MAPQVRRSKTAQSAQLKQYGDARTTEWVVPEEGHTVLEVQKVRDPPRWKDVPIAKNYMIPPYHWHWFQEEHFDIKKGRYIFTSEGVEKKYDSTSGRIAIPPTIRHTFRPDPSFPTECEIHISLTGASGMDESFFRNIYSYLDDCQAQDIAPSLPQLLLFLDSGECSLAFPGPRWLMGWLSWGMGVVVGRWWGGYVLGLKSNYPEYFDPEMVRIS